MEALMANPSPKAAPSNSNSVAYEASRIAKAVGGICYGVSGYNSSGSTQFIQLHDSATLPANTSIPLLIVAVPTASNFSINFETFGMRFSNGIVVCNSSTGPTLTIGTTDCWFAVRYA